MIRTYSNKKIYKNLKIARVLSILSIVLALLGLIIDLIIIFLEKYTIDLYNFFIYHMCALSIPISQFKNTIENNGQKIIQETETNNDIFSLLTTVLASTILPIFIYALFYSSKEDYHSIYLPNILIYIVDIFFIQNCILIKREWQISPPEFYKIKIQKKELKQQEKEQQLIEQLNNRNMSLYNSLIEKCGIKFFIKYYKQIERLPLRDVSINENYSQSEKNERLLSAKKIINLNLTEFTLTEILKSYSDVLDDSEITQAKSILAELQSNTHQL